MNIPPWLSGRARGLGVIESSFHPPPLDEAAIRAALDRPIWADGARRAAYDVIRPGETVCLVVSDYTRKTAADAVLPALLEGFEGRGCRLEDFRVLVASGIHRRTTDAETRAILGARVYRRFQGRIFQHDPDDASGLVTVGVTRRGHPVRVNRRAMEADRRVLVGSANYHYHAGFGGGRKLLVPGLAGRETIAYSHSLTLDPRADRVHPLAAPGVLDGNPVAEEMMEGTRFCRPDLLVNTVLDAGGRIVGLFCGELDAAHRAACRLVERVSRVDLREAADIVIAATSAPDWIQAHKALFNSHRAVKPDTGRVVLLAPCPEGLGNARFRYWLKQPDLPTLFSELRKTPEVNGQTALSTRMRGRQAILVTAMSAPDCADLGIRTAPDLDAALRLALADLAAAPKPTYYLMPQAGIFLPCIAPAE